MRRNKRAHPVPVGDLGDSRKAGRPNEGCHRLAQEEELPSPPPAGEGPGEVGGGLGAEDGHVWPSDEEAASPWSSCRDRACPAASASCGRNAAHICARTRKAVASPVFRQSLCSGTEHASAKDLWRGRGPQLLPGSGEGGGRPDPTRLIGMSRTLLSETKAIHGRRANGAFNQRFY